MFCSIKMFFKLFAEFLNKTHQLIFKIYYFFFISILISFLDILSILIFVTGALSETDFSSLNISAFFAINDLFFDRSCISIKGKSGFKPSFCANFFSYYNLKNWDI